MNQPSDNSNLVEEKDPILLRFAYLVFFYLVFRIVEVAVLGICLLQSLHAVVLGAPQADLHRFSGSLSAYLQSLSAYVMWRSDEKPYPFAEWPKPTEDVSERGAGES